MTAISSSNTIGLLARPVSMSAIAVSADRTVPVAPVEIAPGKSGRLVELSNEYTGLKDLLDKGSDRSASYVAQLQGEGMTDVGLYADGEKIGRNLLQAVATAVSEQAAKGGMAIDAEEAASVLADMSRASLDRLSAASDPALVHPDSLFVHLSDADRSEFADMLTSAVTAGKPVSDVSRLAARRGFESTVTMYDGPIRFEKIDMTHEEAQAYVAKLLAQDNGGVLPPSPTVLPRKTVSGGTIDTGRSDDRRNAAPAIVPATLSPTSFDQAAYSADSMKAIVDAIEGSGWK